MSWHREPPAGFDLEATGPEPLDARAVRAAAAAVRGRAITGPRTRPGGPGARVPAWVFANDGIGAERAAGDRSARAAAAGAVTVRRAGGVPVVAHGAGPFPRTTRASRLPRGARWDGALG